MNTEQLTITKDALPLWTPPSLKSMQKLPQIIVDGDRRIETYLDWFNKNGTIPRTIPPIYRDFVLSYTWKYPGEPKPYNYMDCVHYDDSLTSLHICHVIDGKKALYVYSEYVKYVGTMVHCIVRIPQSTQYRHEWLKKEGLNVLYSVLAVQAYILYHKPEIVPVYDDSQKSAKNKKGGGGKDSGEKSRKKTITPVTHKIIRLSETESPPAQRNYRAIQWTVRGHYRRLKHKDESEYMVYVRPHIAARGKKKLVEGDIVLKGGEPENGKN